MAEEEDLCMNSFSFYNPANILLGTDVLDRLPDLLKKYDVHSLLFVYSGEFIKTLGIWDSVKNACDNNGIDFYSNGNVVPNPKVELVRELISFGKEKKVDFILACGGGSSIDTAKATAVGIPYDGDVWDFFEFKAVPKTAVNIGVISTIPSSGSESSNAAIISNGLHKCGIEYDILIPKFAMMNPEYTATLPPYQTSCGLADILSHMLERYFTNTLHVDTTDYMLEGAMKALFINAERIMKNPHDINARAEVQCLAFIAHNGLLEIGRETDWGTHRIEHELSAQYGITHGEGIAIITIGWAKYAAKHNPEKLAQLANRIFDVDYYNYSKEEMAEILAEKLKSYFSSLNLHTTLSEINIDESHFEEMALRATNNDTQTVGHYIPLNKDRFIEILKLSL